MDLQFNNFTSQMTGCKVCVTNMGHSVVLAILSCQSNSTNFAPYIRQLVMQTTVWIPSVHKCTSYANLVSDTPRNIPQVTYIFSVYTRAFTPRQWVCRSRNYESGKWDITWYATRYHCKTLHNSTDRSLLLLKIKQ